MAVIETWLTQDLKKPVQVQSLCGNFFSHNGNANRIGVRVYDDGEPATLTGTVSGYAVLPDGTTVPCTGTLSGNSASVLLPAAAYVPGNICVTIMLTSGTTITTLAALTGSVVMARTDTQVDPGSVVTDWTNTINAALQTVEGYTGNIIATPYASLTYPVPLGKYCIYNDLLYRCVSPIASSESWTASHWVQVKLADDVSDLKSALSIITDGELLTGWQTGKRIATNVTTVAYGTPSSNSGWDCIVVDCNEGDIFTLSGSSTSSVYALWCWCKTDGTKVLAASTTFTYDKVEIKAPANAKKLIVNSANKVEHLLVAGRIIGTNMDSLYAGDDNVVNLFSYIKKENESDTGYSLTWNTKETGCAVVANLSSLKTIYLYRNATKLPNGMKAGGKYRLILQSENVELRMFWYDASGGSTTIFTKKGFNNDVFTIPAEAIGLAVTLRIPANTEVDETVYTFIYQENSDIEKFAFTQSMVLQNKNEEENLILTMNPKGKTTEKISYTWDLVDMSCTVIGNISSSSYCDIFRDVTAMPSSMVPGGNYVVACDSDIVKLRFIWYDSNGDDYLLAMTKGKDPMAITIPSEAVGLTIRLYISTTGVDINEKVYSYIFNALTDFDKKLSKERLGIGNTQGNENAHLIAVGNSFMSGAVWIGGHSDHSYSEYNNSVYGNIATTLSVPQVNVDFTLHSSSGIIKKNDDKNLLDIIKTKDLTGYDYLLTMISGSDMAYGIGDINATADDGTIAGAVVSLISYATTSNGMCKVILLSVPPYSSDTDKSGANTFTGLYSNGKSLTDLDELMYALAKKYHFTFISWQDNPMSYHYMDFADYIGPNEGSRHANSEDTYRAMGEYAAMQMMAVNSPIALKMIAELN